MQSGGIFDIELLKIFCLSNNTRFTMCFLLCYEEATGMVDKAAGTERTARDRQSLTIFVVSVGCSGRIWVQVRTDRVQLLEDNRLLVRTQWIVLRARDNGSLGRAEVSHVESLNIRQQDGV